MITRMLVIVLFLGMFSTPGSAKDINSGAEKQVDFMATYQQIHNRGSELLQNYTPAQGAAIGDQFSSLYFDIFEASGMEQAIGMQDPTLKTKIESQFSHVIGLAMREAEKSQIDSAWTQLDATLKEVNAASHSSQTGSFWSTLIQSFLILLREGFEAMLVVTALIAYLKKTGAENQLKIIYQGIFWAFVASAATAYLFTVVLALSGKAREALEGVTMLVAAGVLFYVSCWLFAKREASRWQRYVEHKISSAVSGGKLFSLGFAAFLAVYREGAETILFYQALASNAANQTSALTLGAGGATLALLLLYWSMKTASIKLPTGLFFTATAGLIYCFAVVFAGKGVLELQEALWISITQLSWLPRIEWLGVFPTLESLLAQLLLVVPVLLATFWLRTQRQARNAQELLATQQVLSKDFNE